MKNQNAQPVPREVGAALLRKIIRESQDRDRQQRLPIEQEVDPEELTAEEIEARERRRQLLRAQRERLLGEK